jgi:hypothetical protein
MIRRTGLGARCVPKSGRERLQLPVVGLVAAVSGTAARLVLASDGSLLHVLAMSISRHLSVTTAAALPTRAPSAPS